MNLFRTSLLFFLSALAGAQAATLADPTRPPNYSSGMKFLPQPEQENVDFNLTAIRIDPDGRSAIINGQLVRPGGTVDTARLLEVHPAHVILVHDNERIEVLLYQRLEKNRAESAMQGHSPD